MRTFISPVIFGLALCACAKDKDDEEKTADASADAQASITPVNCIAEKTPQEFVTTVTQDLYGRQPTPQELAAATTVTPEEFVETAIHASAADDGITRFASNLFRLANLKPMDDEDADEVALVADLKQEPVVLVLRNKDLPWKHIFETTDVYCTERTARLYDYPVYNTEGFVSCKLPPERAGILGLVSVLRSMSPEANPQAFYKGNNNYHRVSATLYLLLGIQLQAATNGPAGDGPGVPLDSCVPATDMRQAPGGLIYGTASIPLAGSVCSTCHSRYLAPMSIAFRRFGPQGEVLNLEDIDRLSEEDRGGIPNNHLKAILAEQHSCWSPVDGAIPERFVGMPGFAKIAAASPTLGRALGVQIPQLLANVAPDANMVESIENSYKQNGETLISAFKGFFLSDSYRCARKIE